MTGGAAGVGYAYADEFVSRGHKVMICDIVDPQAAVASIKAKHGKDAQIFGERCDVSETKSVRELAAAAQSKLGKVHYWINNAGINGGRRPFARAARAATFFFLSSAEGESVRSSVVVLLSARLLFWQERKPREVS